MGTTENLKKIISRQQEALKELETECRAIENSDTEQENIKLKTEFAKIQCDYEKVKSDALALVDENAGLKNALYEQIYNEKINIVNATTKKLDIYFKAQLAGEQNRLMVLEHSVKSRINEMTATLQRYHIEAKDDLYVKLDELTNLLNQKVSAVRASSAYSPAAFSAAESAELEALKKEQITDEQIRSITKKNNVERFVGLNLLNAIGIFLIIIGVITAARYTYVQLPDLLKGIMVFTFGVLMLVAGELMNSKKANVFSLGITAGGIGVLYVALVTSFFGLKILAMYPAIVVCILITTVAFILSNRYRSQTILVFALIGGYLPMFSVNADVTIIYGAMMYFVVLNLLVYSVSCSRKWWIASFVGLFLNIIGTIYICSIYRYSSAYLEKAIIIIYVLFAFLIYTLIPIVSSYRTKTKFRNADVVLLAINTFFSSIIMYGVFYMLRLKDFDGALAIVFALTYLFLGRLIEKKFSSEERKMSALFYLTGLAFVVLTIPLQFGRSWLSLGWLIEGVTLTVYGILYHEKSYKRVGLIISSLCLTAFLLVDCLGFGDGMFAYKYLAMTLGSLIILGAYMWKGMLAGRFVRIYKYFVLVNVWFYLLYIMGKLKIMLFNTYGYGKTFDINYLITAATIIGTFLIAYVLPRIKILSGRGMKIMSILLYIIGNLWLFIINSAGSPINHLPSASLLVMLVGTLILTVVGLISVITVRDLVRLIVTGRKLGIEWYPLIISGYFVLILTQNLISQYGLSFASAAISIIYVITALIWIIYGFVKRYSFIRKFGLGLAILAVIKLFLIDLLSLTKGYQIISYFVLGLTLVTISFVYQYFSKRLELKEEVSFDVEENN